GLSFVRGMEKEANGICIRLREEARVLMALAPHPGFPAFYDLVEKHDETFLIMEDVEGESIEAYVSHLRTRGRKMPVDQIIAWGKELATLLNIVHARGFIHRDLKSANVMIAPDNHLRLLDFGIARQIEEPDRWPGAGTFGYMSPQQERGEAVTRSDDIYALGALLYFMATGAEPSLAPREKPLTARPLAILNPHLPVSLVRLIERCLAQEPAERFSSALELEEALEALSNQPEQTLFVVDSAQTHDFANQKAPGHYRQLARRLGETLSQLALPDTESNGLRWTSTHYVGKGMQALDLNMGNSGSLFALSELVDEFGDSQQRQVAKSAARWLAGASRLSKTSLAGLYVGEAGVGAALLRAGQILDDSTLISAAVARSRWIARLPFLSPDLFNGTAGRIRFHLWLWDVTADPEQLVMATNAGESLLASAEELASREVCWRIPEGYAGMSGQAYLGYAHGAAGIADVLLDLYEATNQERFLLTAQRAGQWLQRQAVPVLGDESGLDWPVTEGAAPHGAYWCHGATGIGGFFLHLARLRAHPEALLLAQRAARTVVYGNRACGPVQCHGLSGNIEFLLDMARESADQRYLRWALELAELLESFALEKDGLLMWSSESPITTTPDYQVGFAGIAMTLLRLADPRRPRQAGREGFRYRASR
ncbi:MAG TPA: protein kinase/lanthionine synthetase C family protein, partial [Ktedonobacteraceae bacterium]|nr:protein kinase/lanthionine synthetase C family protein [Ktedonobacteraceae bacterium]